ncbi:MAG TPA: pilus assembly protein TadG-related protein [Blastocatellia bacterium]|nr:pilus assembly protein TadG-related protein [Blastocatellia bacterium]
MLEKSLHRDEGGRISIFMVFATIALIFLIALIYNTAEQSIRKIQMQGAADAGAVAGGTQAARDLNDIAANNEAMADILTIMIVLRSTLQTVEVTEKVLAATGIGLPLAAALRVVIIVLRGVDTALSGTPFGVGWVTMNLLDELNVGIKALFPVNAEKITIDYAERNGADRAPHGLLFGGESPVAGLVPFLPVNRGLKEELVDQAEETAFQPFEALDDFVLDFLPVNPANIFKGVIIYNTSNLRGNQVTAVISEFLQFVATGPLEWPNNPPRPMLLTDQPSIDPAGTMEIAESEADLAEVRRYLQYLAVALGKMEKGSRIGGERFLNVAPYESLTYAEADVYNPTDWSMFEQNWKVKQAPAVVLNRKFDAIAGKIGLGGAPQAINGLAFVNNH